MNVDTLPALPLAEWSDTRDTLHMWTQMAGKIALEATPLENHYWNTTLRVTPRGLTTPVLSFGNRSFQITFDFVKHQVAIECETGDQKLIRLEPMTVADFYAKLMTSLDEMGLKIKIWPVPVEVPEPIRFTEDTVHSSYDREYVERFHTVIRWIDKVFRQFRSRFVGKNSPVQFFWGSFDMAVTRFNGELAPPRDGADPVTREAYSHCCISHGFWGGGGEVMEPAFYAYAAPEPAGLSAARVVPPQTYYHDSLGEFILPYEAVRLSERPEFALLDFMQSTYSAAADLAKWDRKALERPLNENARDG